MIRRVLREEHGFTLMELMIVLPMMTLILGSLVWLLSSFAGSSGQTQEETTLQTEARAAMTTLASEIRSAFVGDGTSPIIAATPTSITFYSPDSYPTVVSGTTETSFHLRKITYSVVGGTLERQQTTSTNTYPSGPPWTWPGAAGPQTSVVGPVTNGDVFTYYSAAGAQASPPTALAFPVNTTTAGVRVVAIKLTLNAGGSPARTFTVQDTVALREMDS